MVVLYMLRASIIMTQLKYVCLNYDMSRLVGKSTMWFPNRSDTNRAVQAQKRAARSLKFRKRNCTIQVAKTKALISFAVTTKLICVFVFAYADCWFSHVVAILNDYKMKFYSQVLSLLENPV